MSLFLINVLCSTLTNPVSLEKCLIAIKEKAFSSSEYPVCVTLEDHLTSDLQAKAAEVCDVACQLKTFLGRQSYYQCLSGSSVPGYEMDSREVVYIVVFRSESPNFTSIFVFHYLFISYNDLILSLSLHRC